MNADSFYYFSVGLRRISRRGVGRQLSTLEVVQGVAQEVPVAPVQGVEPEVGHAAQATAYQSVRTPEVRRTRTVPVAIVAWVDEKQTEIEDAEVLTIGGQMLIGTADEGTTRRRMTSIKNRSSPNRLQVLKRAGRDLGTGGAIGAGLRCRAAAVVVAVKKDSKRKHTSTIGITSRGKSENTRGIETLTVQSTGQGGRSAVIATTNGRDIADDRGCQSFMAPVTQHLPGPRPTLTYACVFVVLYSLRLKSLGLNVPSADFLFPSFPVIIPVLAPFSSVAGSTHNPCNIAT